ncbi:hypothetical protein [Paracoccus sphaerophysae]|uniref:Uncharacterized protein n=1 Tax=Paracoccus sphaerophysae TaxID=690417 RepID=A0A099FCR2_9RHOB|nr:hypothetical protein [Paracoccus sphaerophysae]KGJ07991.1 hypothetical protein IC63_06460 [Paracoccus sphaerophysae]
MVAITECRAAPAARGWNLRARWAEYRARKDCRASLGELPADLRRDVGVDGGLPLARHENGGRVFVSHGRPDSTLSGWHW